MELRAQSSRDETRESTLPEGAQGGRPRRWASAAAKHRAHRARRAQREALVEALLEAVRNARLDDAALHRVAQHGDDAALLEALGGYYRARHWQLGSKGERP